MSDQQVFDSLTAIDRPGQGGIDLVRQVVITNQSKINNGDDTVSMSLISRMAHAAEATVGTNPFGASPANNITLQGLAHVRGFLRILDWQDEVLPDFTSPWFTKMLDQMETAGIIDSADNTAIQAAADNMLSRAAEIGLGGSWLTVDRVAAARA